jgi:hypothetical protein
MLPTSGQAKVSGGKFGLNKKVADTSHQNSPFRDLEKDGHELNHGYKVPAANLTGVNHSYMHPLVPGLPGGTPPGFPTPKIQKISPLDQHGKGGK